MLPTACIGYVHDHCLLFSFAGVFVMKKADGESFVSALYKKYENDDEEQLEIEILVPKSAPGYTS